MTEFVKTFRDSVPYLQAHQGACCVVGIDGAALASGMGEIAHDLLLMQALGMRLVVVLGARPQIQSALDQAGIKNETHNRLRITTTAAQQVVNAAVGELRVEFEAALSKGLPESPYQHRQVPVVSGNFVIAQPMGVRDGVDFQRTGEVRRVEVAGIRQQLDLGAIVLLPCLGSSPSGEIFNLGADELAAATAEQLQADKLAWLGPIEAQPAWPQVLTPAQAADTDDRVQALLADAAKAVARVHRLDSAIDGALLKEFYTRDGAGLLITDGGYDVQRSASADDIGGVLGLISPLEEQGVLVPRSREQLELEIERFQILERDGLVVACAALYPIVDSEAGELACLAVHEGYRQRRLAKVLLRSVENLARAQGLTDLFVLTTHTAHWFKEQGFEPTKPERLPGARQAFYNNQRNSQVLVKAL